MRVLTARWVAGSAAVASVALTAAAVPVAYADRHLVPARLAGWGFSYVFEEVVSLAVPVVGFVLASRRPRNWIGWLFLAAGLVLALRSFSHQYALHALVAAPGSWPAGPGIRLDVQLGVGDPLRHARVCVFDLPDWGTCAPRGGARSPGS
jgi:hypothetical protein